MSRCQVSPLQLCRVLVESDGRLGVFPSADEHFDHGLGDRIAAKQRNVGVVMAPDIES